MREIYQRLGFEPGEIQHYVRWFDKFYRARSLQTKPPSPRAVGVQWDALRKACVGVVEAIDGLSDHAATAIRDAKPIPQSLADIADSEPTDTTELAEARLRRVALQATDSELSDTPIAGGDPELSAEDRQFGAMLVHAVREEHYRDPLSQLRDMAAYIIGMNLSINILDRRPKKKEDQVFRYPEPKHVALDQFVELASRLFQRKSGRRPTVTTIERESGDEQSPTLYFKRFLLALAEDAEIPSQGLVERFRKLRKRQRV